MIEQPTHTCVARYSGETEASCTLTGALRTEGHGANEVSAAGGVDVTKSWKPLVYQVLHVVHHRAEESVRERGRWSTLKEGASLYSKKCPSLPLEISQK